MAKLYRIPLPPIKGSGGRVGENLIVTGVRPDGSIAGETAHGLSTEMEHGDLLLNVKPSGLARDTCRVASLFTAVNGVLHHLMTVNWPQDQPRLARRIQAFQSSGVRERQADPLLSAEVVFRAAIREALGSGVPADKIIAIAMEAARVDSRLAAV